MNKIFRIRLGRVVWLQIVMAVMLLGMSTPAAALDSDGFVFPVLGVSQTDPVTNTSNPLDDGWNGNGLGASVSGFGDGHLGQDYAKAGCAGLPVYAVSKGKVVQVIDADNQYGWNDGADHGWGRVIIIEHTLSSGFKTDNAMVTTTPNEANFRKVYSLYGHLKRGSIIVSVGDPVEKGQKIAEIGQDGVDLNTGGSHLHFEIKNGSAYASKEFSPKNGFDAYCCGNQPTCGVGFGYSGKQNYAPNRYIPSVFIENNKAINSILIKPASDTTIYWLQHGIIYPVSAPSIIDTMKAAGIANWDWGKVVTVSDISNYTAGPTILTATSASDNLLMKDVSTKRIYKMNNGVKEYQSTLASFADVIDMAPAYFAQETSGTYTVGQSATTEAIRQVFVTTYNANAANLGSPTDVVKETSSGTGVAGYYQAFDNGSIQYMASGANAGSAFAVYEEIYDKWAQLHYASSPLGLPTGSQSAQFTSSQGTTGYYQSFEGGSIQVNINDNIKYAYAVYGKIYEKWGQLNYAAGLLGLPIGDIIENVRSGFGTAGYYQRFENGSIQVIGTNAYAVSGVIYGEWGKHGYAGKFTPGDDTEIAQTTWAGFPTSDAYAWSGMTRHDFEGGYIQTDGVTAGFISDKHPQNLTATVRADNSVLLNWQNRIAASGINVYRTGSPTEMIATLSPDATSYTDASAVAGHPYTYHVSAYNDTAESQGSNAAAVNGVVWNVNQTLGQNGPYDFAGIYEFSDLTIGDNVEITSSGISQLVLYVHGTLALGKNVAIRVRNGFYPGAPATPISSITAENINTVGINTGNYYLFPNSFGKGGDGGNSSGHNNSWMIYSDGNRYMGVGGPGGGGFGGGNGGKLSILAYEVYEGQPNGGNGSTGGRGWNRSNSSPAYVNGGQGGTGGGATDLGGVGGTGIAYPYASAGGGGGGNGGSGGVAGIGTYVSYSGPGSGGGGYGAGILTIIASNIEYSSAFPPKFLVSGQKGGSSNGNIGANGEGGLLIINSTGFLPLPPFWSLGSNTYGSHLIPSTNGGHGIQTGGPQKVLVNGYEAKEILAGMVSDSLTGAPIPNVEISINDSSVTKTVTDANGRYAFGGLLPGAYQIILSNIGYQEITKSATVAAGQGMTLDATLPVSLSGTVKDSSGSPISGVAVATTGGNTTTDASGKYVLGSLPPALYTITFSKTGYQTVTMSTIVAVGQSTTLDADLPVSLSGTVRDSSGSPLSGVAVATTGTNATTDGSGKYALGGLVPAPYTITFSKTGYQTITKSTTVVVGQSTILDATLPVSLSGTVKDMSTGNLITSVTVTATGGTTVQTNTSGYYALGSLSPGVYEITFTKSGYQTVTASNVVIRAGEATVLNMELTTPGLLNIATTALAPADTGNQYNPRVKISGGVYPYTYTIAYGALPPGLTLDPATGNITGTPTTPGAYTFAISVTDKLDAYAESEFTIEVTSPLVITTASTLPRATRGASYLSSIKAIGGTQPYVLSIQGSFQHSYQFFDQSNHDDTNENFNDWSLAKAACENRDGHLVTITSVEEELYLASTYKNKLQSQLNSGAWIGNYNGSWITEEPVSYTDWGYNQPSSSPCARIDVAAYGTTPRWFTPNCINTNPFYLPDYICEYETNTIANTRGKMTLDQNGNVVGKPSAIGSVQFTVVAVDASSRTITKNFGFEVDDPLVITTPRFNDGIVGTAYNQTIAASGGYGSYQWAVFSGTLPDGLSLDPQTGVISGTPAASTYGIIILSVTDDFGRVTYKDYSIKISDPLRVLTSALPKGLRNEAYSEAIRKDGGIGPYTFSYSGTLPAGLSLNTSTGAISGTPTTAGLTNFGITVSDSTYPTAQTVTQNLSLRVTSVLTVTTSEILPNIKKDVAISPLTLVAKGGASPYTWAFVSGTLPGGISLDPQTGQITGTPTEKGDFVFTIAVTDNASATDQKELFWHISETLSIETGAVPDGAKGVPASIALSAKGGLKPYVWALKSGTLPTGLTINPSIGTIYGTPTTKQTYSFTVEVSDSDSPAQKAEKTYIMDVLDSLYVYTKTVPNGRINDPYTATIEAKLGTPPYAWRLDSGTLPVGLRLNTSSTVATVEGTPETTGPYTYTLEVSDSGTPVQRNTKEFTFQVYSDVVVDSAGLKTAIRGVSYSDSVVVTGGLLPYVYSITAGSLPSGLALNTATGNITGTTDMTLGQSLAFSVRVTDSGNPSDFAERQFAIYVIDPLEITTASIQKAMQKSFYQVSFSGNGGISPYTWGISDGTLPQGIAIATDTGILSGTPVNCGTFNFTALLTDSAPTPNTFPKAFGVNVLCSNDYDLAGSIPTLAGANIALSGNQTSVTTTDSNGNYKFQHLTNGNYSVTPYKYQYWFEPASKNVTVNNLDMAGVDFVAHADSTPPVVGITINGGGASQTINRTFTQTATATDASSMTYSWSKQAGPGDVTFATATGLSSTITASLEGTYTIRFTATDAAGNSAFSDMTLVWDTTPPVAVIGAPSTTVTKAGSVTYTVTYTGADAVTLAAEDVTLVKTGTADGTIAVSGTENTTRTVTISGITGDGTLGLSIAAGTASDLAGNQAIAVGPSATFIVDNTPPVVNPGGNQTKNGTFTQTATGMDANTMTYSWSKQAGPGTVTFGTVDALSSTITASLEGTYTIRFTATDAAGNSAFSDMTLVWDTTPPVA
ncbi:MAG: putative Ig domain-containing protein, partial [Syntrophales bacterium]